MSTITTDDLERLYAMSDNCEPLHIGVTDASPYAFCGFVFTEAGGLPWEEVPDERTCPTCLAVWRRRFA